MTTKFRIGDNGRDMKTAIRSWLVAAGAALALCAPVSADPLEDGVAAYRDKDYAKAVELWSPLAEKGNAVAQYRLGTLYAEGKGVAQDDATAATWFLKAAEQGNASAQYDLAASYAEGIGVKKDAEEAAKWFRHAADQQMGYAQLNLGMLYASGHGVPQDNVEALKWIELSVYTLPPGAARSDAARALKDVADKMSAEEIMEAKGRARSWKPPPAGAPLAAKTDASPTPKSDVKSK
jgi:TPR repeat protein